jgi:predicted small secreted protein
VTSAPHFRRRDFRQPDFRRRDFRRQAAVVLLALAGSLALAGCQTNDPISTEPTSQGSTVSTSAVSTLDAAGVEHIRASKTARLDKS